MPYLNKTVYKEGIKIIGNFHGRKWQTGCLKPDAECASSFRALLACGASDGKGIYWVCHNVKIHERFWRVAGGGSFLIPENYPSEMFFSKVKQILNDCNAP